MIVTTNQSIFLPWPGFFYKALRADTMVLLDTVQFPLGRNRSWMTRNRLKSDQGELWLRVPVWKAGKGKQIIRVDLNVELIRFLWDALGLRGKLVLQSELDVSGMGTELLVSICHALDADTYVTLPFVEKHLEPERFLASGITFSLPRFRPPVYPQLWGEFRYNLSVIDLLFNCGPKSLDIIAQAGD